MCRAKNLVDSEGLEPPTYWFEANRSIQLSYESKFSRCEARACGEVAVGRARMRKFGEKGAFYTLDGSGGFRANKTTACGPKGARGLNAKSA